MVRSINTIYNGEVCRTKMEGDSMGRYIRDTYRGVPKKRTTSVALDEKTMFFLRMLAHRNNEQDFDNNINVSQLIRTSIFMYLSLTCPEYKKCQTVDDFIVSNGRTGKIYNSERY